MRFNPIIILLPFILCLANFKLLGQSTQPKLMVGIIIDQMRYEYLNRYYDKFDESGFKRLMRQGFNLKNAHYNYIPTYTGPGHASVYTGTTPTYHGIIANDWYDKFVGEEVYCVEDHAVKGWGMEGRGEVSAKRMLSTTITDELLLSNQKKSKVIAISIKDRGAALPAGHMGDAFWYDYPTGEFISSSYYMPALPQWVKAFNDKGYAKKYLGGKWNTLLPIERYTESGPDESPYEFVFMGKEKPTFPYHLKKLQKLNKGTEFLVHTPFGNTIVTDMALAAIEAENLGNNGYTDFLAISFSSTDIIGHEFGPNSVEVEDTYLRLDQELGRLLDQLDLKVGKDNYTLFLTADHAAADVPQYLTDNNTPAGYLDGKKAKESLSTYLKQQYGEGNWVENISNGQVFLNHSLFNEKKLSILDAQRDIGGFLLQLEGVARVFSSQDILAGNYDEGGIKGALIRGYNQKRSGDILFSLEPGWFHAVRKGTTHGSGYSYDTHVPLLWFGANIPQGESVTYHPITDIAATLAIMLNTKFPNSCTGQPIQELFK